MVVQAFAWLTYAAIPIAFLLLAFSAYQHAQLLRNLGLGREGLLLFWQQLTLKAWVAAFLFWILLSTALGPFGLPLRRGVNLAFALAIVAQALFSVVTNHRWRKPRKESNG